MISLDLEVIFSLALLEKSECHFVFTLAEHCYEHIFEKSGRVEVRLTFEVVLEEI